ncbi:MAG TPA: NADH-quinone oxidoreductase subunit C [Desulfobulbus sp.]|nr:NADH-quinone oxidoreductase subunit C [Desulfobulbus sp.]
MESMEIAGRLQTQFPDQVVDVCSFHGQVGVLTRREQVVDMLRWLRDTPGIRMNHLMDLCGVDNGGRNNAALQRFEVVYNLYSVPNRHSLRIRAQIPQEDPCIDSVTALWAGADWHERECFDLMGISFNGHKNMTRILLPEDWQGHPLRKEYPLKGRQEWSGMDDLLHKVEQLQEFGFSDAPNQENEKS